MQLENLIIPLLTCLRTTLTTELRASLQQVSVASWEQLLDLATRQQVAALFYHRLKSHQLEALVPTHVMQQLQKRYHANAIRNLQIYRDLADILQLLNQNNLPVIVLKGAYLGGAIYGNPALRYMSDIDLLVRQDDLTVAQQTLGQIDYLPRQLSADVIPSSAELHLAPLSRPRAVASVEMHGIIAPPSAHFTLDVAELWQQAKPITERKIIGTASAGATPNILALSPEDLLLHICWHAAFQHCFQQGLRSLCDVDAIVHHYQKELDWQQLIVRANQRNWSKGVYLTLALAQRWLETPIPAASLQALQLKDAALAEQLQNEAFTMIFASRTEPELLSRNFVQLWATENWWEKISIVSRRVFLPADKINQVYPAATSRAKRYQAYALRMKDLFKRYSSKLWRLLRKEPAFTVMAERQSRLLEWLK